MSLMEEAIRILLSQRKKWPELKNKKHMILKFVLEERDDKKWYLEQGDYKFIDEERAEKIEQGGRI